MFRPTLDELRARMVANQIASRGVWSPRVLEAMRQVPRHRFVPIEYEAYAHDDHPLQIGCGQTISQPYMVAVMTEMLALRPEDRVLEIGTGSGYQAAVLATLAGNVVSIERHADLADKAAIRLRELGYTNVEVHCGDGTLGYPAGAPYDAIVVTAASPAVPTALKQQLALGGRLVCPTGPRDLQQLVKLVREPDGFAQDSGVSCIFVPLIGEQGWQPEELGNGGAPTP